MLKERTNLDKHEIIDLINLCLQAAIFEHNDDVYKQTHGTPMGSPISVVLAELVIQKIEEKIMNNPPCPHLVWKRYIDDVITILPRDNVPTFLNYINSMTISNLLQKLKPYPNYLTLTCCLKDYQMAQLIFMSTGNPQAQTTT